MAEIKIEPKKRSGWSWVIVLLILAVVGWLVYRYFLEPRPVENIPPPAASLVVPVPPGFLFA